MTSTSPLGSTASGPVDPNKAEPCFVYLLDAQELPANNTLLLFGVDPQGRSVCLRAEKMYQKWYFVPAKQTQPTTTTINRLCMEIGTFLAKCLILDYSRPTELIKRKYLYPCMRNTTLSNTNDAIQEEQTRTTYHSLNSVYVDQHSAEYRPVWMAEVVIRSGNPYPYGSKALRLLLQHIHSIPNSATGSTDEMNGGSVSTANAATTAGASVGSNAGWPQLPESVIDILPAFDSILEDFLISRNAQQGGVWLRYELSERRPSGGVVGASQQTSSATVITGAKCLSWCQREVAVDQANIRLATPDEHVTFSLSSFPQLSILSLRMHMDFSYHSSSSMPTTATIVPPGGKRKKIQSATTYTHIRHTESSGDAPFRTTSRTVFVSYSLRQMSASAIHQTSSSNTVQVSLEHAMKANSPQQHQRFLTWLTRGSEQSVPEYEWELQRLIQESGISDPAALMVFPTERAMLTHFIQDVRRLDPDVLCGMNLNTPSQLDALRTRMNELNIVDLTALGRVKHLNNASFRGDVAGGQKMMSPTRGRLVCDLSEHMKDHLRMETAELSLHTLAHLPQVAMYDDEYQPPQLRWLVNSLHNVDALLRIIPCVMAEHEIQHRVLQNIPVLTLAHNIAHKCGCLVSHTLNPGKAVRTMYLLLHTFHRAGYITPTQAATDEGNRLFFMAKGAREESSGRKHKGKGEFPGGLNLPPRVFLYKRTYHAEVDVINDGETTTTALQNLMLYNF